MKIKNRFTSSCSNSDLKNQKSLITILLYDCSNFKTQKIANYVVVKNSKIYLMKLLLSVIYQYFHFLFEQDLRLVNQRF